MQSMPLHSSRDVLHGPKDASTANWPPSSALWNGARHSLSCAVRRVPSVMCRHPVRTMPVEKQKSAQTRVRSSRFGPSFRVLILVSLSWVRAGQVLGLVRYYALKGPWSCNFVIDYHRHFVLLMS